MIATLLMYPAMISVSSPAMIPYAVSRSPVASAILYSSCEVKDSMSSAPISGGIAVVTRMTCIAPRSSQRALLARLVEVLGRVMFEVSGSCAAALRSFVVSVVDVGHLH